MTDKIPVALSANDIENSLRAHLPSHLQSYAHDFAILFAIFPDGEERSESIRQYIINNPHLVEVFTSLAGQKITTGNSVLVFGENGQIGDVTLRDVAGRDILTYNFNFYYNSPSILEKLSIWVLKLVSYFAAKIKELIIRIRKLPNGITLAIGIVIGAVLFFAANSYFLHSFTVDEQPNVMNRLTTSTVPTATLEQLSLVQTPPNQHQQTSATTPSLRETTTIETPSTLEPTNGTLTTIDRTETVLVSKEFSLLTAVITTLEGETVKVPANFLLFGHYWETGLPYKGDNIIPFEQIKQFNISTTDYITITANITLRNGENVTETLDAYSDTVLTSVTSSGRYNAFVNQVQRVEFIDEHFDLSIIPKALILPINGNPIEVPAALVESAYRGTYGPYYSENFDLANGLSIPFHKIKELQFNNSDNTVIVRLLDGREVKDQLGDAYAIRAFSEFGFLSLNVAQINRLEFNW